jgi:hypothetical protein
MTRWIPDDSGMTRWIPDDSGMTRWIPDDSGMTIAGAACAARAIVTS